MTDTPITLISLGDQVWKPESAWYLSASEEQIYYLGISSVISYEM